jgi:hypothetical protein
MNKFKVGDIAWTLDVYGDHLYYIDGTIKPTQVKIESLCQVASERAIVSITKPATHRNQSITEYHVVYLDNLFHSKYEALKCKKSLSSVIPGDLVTFVHRDWSKSAYGVESMQVGTCIKLTDRYAHIMTENGIKKINKRECIINSRPEKV